MVKKILVVRVRHVGDALLSTALCSSLRKTFPEAEIHYVLNEAIAPLFRDDPSVDNFITFSIKDHCDLSAYLKKVKRTVRENKYDVIIDVRSNFKSSFFSLFSKKTPYRIGFRNMHNRIACNYRVKSNKNTDAVKEVLGLLEPLAKKYELIKETGFKVYVTPEEKLSMRSYMLSKGVDISKPVMLCGVACRKPKKAWNIEYMRDVLKKVAEHFDVQMIFNYAGSDEKSQAIMLKEMLAADGVGRVFTNIEAVGLRELAAMTANSNFYFGNEGGTRHIAQALEVPAYAVFSPNVYKSQMLIGESPDNQGIEYVELLQEGVTGRKMSYEEKFDIIKPGNVWEGLKPMLERLFPDSIKKSVN